MMETMETQLQHLERCESSPALEKHVNVKFFMHDLLSIVQNIITGDVSILSLSNNENAWKIEGKNDNPVIVLYYKPNHQHCNNQTQDENRNFHPQQELSQSVTSELADGESHSEEDGTGITSECALSESETDQEDVKLIVNPGPPQYESNHSVSSSRDPNHCNNMPEHNPQRLEPLPCNVSDASALGALEQSGITNSVGCSASESAFNQPIIKHEYAERVLGNSEADRVSAPLCEPDAHMPTGSNDFASCHPEPTRNLAGSVQQDSSAELNDGSEMEVLTNDHVKNFSGTAEAHKSILDHQNPDHTSKNFDFPSHCSKVNSQNDNSGPHQSNVQPQPPVLAFPQQYFEHETVTVHNVPADDESFLKEKLPFIFSANDYSWKYRQLYRTEKSFRCKHCSKTFAQKGGLKAHERIHTGDDIYACRFCSKTFSYRCWLEVHERIHTGEKPFVCSFCQKRFSQISNLKTHQHRHTRKDV